MKYSLGNKIRELRLHKQLTQEQLAQLCKVSSAAISKWEHDLSYPDITLLPILARIFHVSKMCIRDSAYSYALPSLYTMPGYSLNYSDNTSKVLPQIRPLLYNRQNE